MLDDMVSAYGNRFLVAALGVSLALLGLFVIFWFMRHRAPSPFVRGGRNRQPRLQVLDAAAIDARRRLVLVRRDNVEHLVMIGGPTDIVIESGIGEEQPYLAVDRSGEPKAVAAQDRELPIAPAEPARRPSSVTAAPAVPVDVPAVPVPVRESRAPAPRVEPMQQRTDAQPLPSQSVLPDPLAGITPEAEPRLSPVAPAISVTPARPTPLPPAPALVQSPIQPENQSSSQSSAQPTARTPEKLEPRVVMPAQPAAIETPSPRSEVPAPRPDPAPQVQAVPEKEPGTALGADPDFSKFLEDHMINHLDGLKEGRLHGMSRPAPTVLPPVAANLSPLPQRTASSLKPTGLRPEALAPQRPAGQPGQTGGQSSAHEVRPEVKEDTGLQQEIAKIFGEMGGNRRD